MLLRAFGAETGYCSACFVKFWAVLNPLPPQTWVHFLPSFVLIAGGNGKIGEKNIACLICIELQWADPHTLSLAHAANPDFEYIPIGKQTGYFLLELNIH